MSYNVSHIYLCMDVALKLMRHNDFFSKMDLEKALVMKRTEPDPFSVDIAVDRRDETEQCKKLWADVIRQAIEDLTTDSTAIFTSEDEKKIVKRRVVHWFESKDINEGSFLWICRELELDPDYVRSKAYEQR